MSAQAAWVSNFAVARQMTQRRTSAFAARVRNPGVACHREMPLVAACASINAQSTGPRWKERPLAATHACINQKPHGIRGDAVGGHARCMDTVDGRGVRIVVVDAGPPRGTSD